MQISIENKKGLNAQLLVKVEAADYNETLRKALAKYQKTLNIPGFRKGQVPASVVQKMIGTDAKREQVDKLLQDGIQNYIKENKINLVLSPLSNYVSADIDWKAADLTFTYDIGFRPEIKPNLESLNGMQRYVVVHSEDDMAKDLDGMQKSAGKMDMLEEITDDPNMSVSIKFTELDAENNVFEGGQSKQKFYQAADLPKGIKDLIIGKKPGEKFSADLFSALNEDELVALFEVDKMTVRDFNHQFEIEVQAAFSVKPAELNQELFDRYMEPGTVSTEEEFRVEWKKRVEKYYQREADSLFFTEVRKVLPKNTPMELPEEFLKKYYLVSYDAKNESDIENFADQFSKFEEELRWILISDVIAENNNIKVTEEDIISYTLGNIRYQFMQSGMAEPDEKMLQQYAYEYLSKDSNYSRTVMVLKDNAVFDYILTVVKTKDEPINTQKLSEIRKVEEEVVVD